MQLTVFNSCDSRFSQGTLPAHELIMWACSLILYKKAGYKTKLYCTPEDIPCLKQEGLFDLYDEIDTETFAATLDERVNLKYFWSYRKMEALRHEFQISDHSIYSDTDVFILKPFELTHDALFWCEEKDQLVYLDWDNISTPDNYTLPSYIRQTENAYNCGIIWIRNKDIMEEWYREYMQFVVDNPCKLAREDYQNNILACNSEQRILKAVCEKHGLTSDFLATAEQAGISEKGIHWYAYKVIWRYRDMMTQVFGINPQQIMAAYQEFVLFSETVIEKGGSPLLNRRFRQWKKLLI